MGVKSDKGQAAIEYLTVFGIALILSTPFILKAQSSMLELRTGSEFVAMQNSLDKLETSVKTVGASGEPAQRTFFFEVSENIESGLIQNNSVVYTFRTQSGESQMIRSFDQNITGNIPGSPGRHKMTVYAEDREVVLGVVS